mmetsp:Transcript_14421/g.22376  ORF Transcript_14421/g.22376 Transcript_14421/m.22376 type:complete len:102 (+) Transcript_14421:211-516(+)
MMVHIIEADPNVEQGREAQMQQQRTDPQTIRRGHHIALTVDNMDAVAQLLDAHSIEYHTNWVPGTKVRQFFFYDPDGNGIEIGDFAPRLPPFKESTFENGK